MLRRFIAQWESVPSVEAIFKTYIWKDASSILAELPFFFLASYFIDSQFIIPLFQLVDQSRHYSENRI